MERLLISPNKTRRRQKINKPSVHIYIGERVGIRTQGKTARHYGRGTEGRRGLMSHIVRKFALSIFFSLSTKLEISSFPN